MTKVTFAVVFMGRESAGRKSRVRSSSWGDILRGESDVYGRPDGWGESLRGERHVYGRLHGASLRGESDVYGRPDGWGESLRGERHVYGRLHGASLRGESHVYGRPHGARDCGAKVTYTAVLMGRESTGQKSWDPFSPIYCC